MTLRELTKNILYEGVSNDEINSAINNHKYVVVNYEGTDGTHNDKRMIQPVAFGCTIAGNPVIRAYEPFGDTKTQVPRWKYLRVDRISSWKETDKTFDKPADLFNPDDDKSMSIVYNIAKFDDNPQNMRTPSSSPKKKTDEKPSLFKTETETGLERLQKQLKNNLTISDFKTMQGFNGVSNQKQKSGPKTKKDVKKGTDSIYTKDYNYNTFDNALDAAGKRTKRNGAYYFQKRNNGKFTKGNVLDNSEVDDSQDINNYLNTDHSSEFSIDDLRKAIGDTSKPISFQELKDRLKNIKK